jgi:hypothetical protein
MSIPLRALIYSPTVTLFLSTALKSSKYHTAAVTEVLYQNKPDMWMWITGLQLNIQNFGVELKCSKIKALFFIPFITLDSQTLIWGELKYFFKWTKITLLNFNYNCLWKISNVIHKNLWWKMFTQTYIPAWEWILEWRLVLAAK